MRIAVVHNAVSDESLPDERDVIVQANVVSDALSQLGHESLLLPCDLNLSSLQQRLIETKPDVVFNLVESLDGKGQLIHVVPSLLETMQIPYTGAPAQSIFLTSNKITAKQQMRRAGLPTPEWVGPCRGTDLPGDLIVPPLKGATRWIIKSVWEHASLGLTDDGVVTPKNSYELVERLRDSAAHLGGNCFAEDFIDGREFNLAILSEVSGPQVLPSAEILFEEYSSDKLRIVCYRAKWDENSFEYSHTPRSFDFPAEDEMLLRLLKELAIQCWTLFELKGYARVDFRVDKEGKPWILEVNTNPCLSPDAGFAAAMERGSISYPVAIRRILDDVHQQNQTARHLIISGETIPVTSVSTNESLGQLDAAYRYEIRPEDANGIRQLLIATSFFNASEVDVAIELIDERCNKGIESGYHFILHEQDGRLLGYTCYGPIPCTESSYDIYWIAVQPNCQGKGLGRGLMAETERQIQKLGGTKIYLDTSQRKQYAGTRAFYERCGYAEASCLKDFYAPGDGKIVYEKSL